MGEPAGTPVIAASRIVVVMPNWLGDGVMATPLLRALRELYPAAHVAAVTRGLVAPVLMGHVDEVRVAEKGKEGATVKWLREQRFELGVLLPNSFRSAWVLWRGGVKRRLGYARGGRGPLLTDRLRVSVSSEQDMAVAGAKLVNQQRIRQWMDAGGVVGAEPQLVDFAGGVSVGKVRRGFKPVPTIEYYLELVRYLVGGDLLPAEPGADRRMGLGVTDEERLEAEGALGQFQISDFRLQSENLVVIVPGANFGASKCWMPERFAAVAEKLADPSGAFRARVLLAGSPAEAPIIDAIRGAISAHKDRVHSLVRVNEGRGISVGALKEIVRRSRLMICNDTGPRHFAAAFGVPVVTLFGPTDPVWAETYFEKERVVRVDVPCGPCQLKKCPIDHRCMRQISVETVMEAVGALWSAR